MGTLKIIRKLPTQLHTIKRPSCHLLMKETISETWSTPKSELNLVAIIILRNWSFSNLGRGKTKLKSEKTSQEDGSSKSEDQKGRSLEGEGRLMAYWLWMECSHLINSLQTIWQPAMLTRTSVTNHFNPLSQIMVQQLIILKFLKTTPHLLTRKEETTKLW